MVVATGSVPGGTPVRPAHSESVPLATGDLHEAGGVYVLAAPQVHQLGYGKVAEGGSEDDRELPEAIRRGANAVDALEGGRSDDDLGEGGVGLRAAQRLGRPDLGRIGGIGQAQQARNGAMGVGPSPQKFSMP